MKHNGEKNYSDRLQYDRKGLMNSIKHQSRKCNKIKVKNLNYINNILNI